MRLLVDTNLLVLWIIGSVSRDEIARNRRTSKYDARDFLLLTSYMGQYQEFVITPHIAAETSNLVSSLTGKSLFQARAILAAGLRAWNEVYVESVNAAELPQYIFLGLTDAAVLLAAQNAAEVITDDFDLYRELLNLRLKVTNFTHLKTSGWLDD